MQKDKYYILKQPFYAPYVLTDIVNLKINYLGEKQRHSFLYYSLIKEPMLFTGEKQEKFTGIPVIETSSIGVHDSEKYTKKIPKGKLISTKKSDDIAPFIHMASYSDWPMEDDCYEEINGSKLYLFLMEIKDEDSTKENPTFNRHINVLNSLFANACKKAELPFSTVAEYHDYVLRKKIWEQQKIERISQSEELYNNKANQILSKIMR